MPYIFLFSQLQYPVEGRVKDFFLIPMIQGEVVFSVKATFLFVQSMRLFKSCFILKYPWPEQLHYIFRIGILSKKPAILCL